MGGRWGRLLREEGLLVVVIGLGNVANFIFHIYMSRNLGTDGYGTLSALVGLLYVLAIPTLTIQASLAQFIASKAALDDVAGARAIFIGGARRVGLLALAGTVAVAVAAPVLQSYLHLADTRLIWLFALLTGLTIVGPAFWGGLQGLRLFRALGGTLLASMTAKCVLGIALVMMGGAVAGALWGLILAAAAGIGIATVCMREAFRGVERDIAPADFAPVARYAVPVMLGFFALSPFANLDTFLARHYLDAAAAGRFASAMILGKAFLFLPAGIVLALFPNVAHAVARDEDPRQFLWPALGLGAGLSVVGACICVAAPGLLARLLVRTADPEILPLIRWVGFAITPVGLSTILLQYHLARKHWMCLPGLLAAGVGFVFAVGRWHGSAVQVLTVEAVCGAAAFAVVLGAVWWPGSRSAPA